MKAKKSIDRAFLCDRALNKMIENKAIMRLGHIAILGIFHHRSWFYFL
jgi:hypothetical protein